MIVAQRRQYYDDVEQTVARPRLRSKRKAAVLFALSCALMAAVSLGTVHQKTAIAEAGYELLDWQEQLQEAKEQNVRLNVAAANLRSLSRIETVARTKLGMVSPEKVEFLVLDDSETVVASVSESPVQWTLPGKVMSIVGEVIQVLLPRADTVEAGSIGR